MIESISVAHSGDLGALQSRERSHTRYGSCVWERSHTFRCEDFGEKGREGDKKVGIPYVYVCFELDMVLSCFLIKIFFF